MKTLANLLGKKIILASASPRRLQLVTGLDMEVEVKVKETDESFPDHLREAEIPMHIANSKANAFDGELTAENILITADTIVWIDEKALNKPASREEALEMIRTLSGRVHSVFTGVCIRSIDRNVLFADETKVTFNNLEEHEIAFYVDTYKPYDKAGAYGAQDWIGFVGIKKLEGSYFNVMGLPVHLLYHHLKEF